MKHVGLYILLLLLSSNLLSAYSIPTDTISIQQKAGQVNILNESVEELLKLELDVLARYNLDMINTFFQIRILLFTLLVGVGFLGLTSKYLSALGKTFAICVFSILLFGAYIFDCYGMIQLNHVNGRVQNIWCELKTLPQEQITDINSIVINPDLTNSCLEEKLNLIIHPDPFQIVFFGSMLITIWGLIFLTSKSNLVKEDINIKLFNKWSIFYLTISFIIIIILNFIFKANGFNVILLLQIIFITLFLFTIFHTVYLITLAFPKHKK